MTHYGALALLLAERDENTCRLDFAPTEAFSIVRALRPLEEAAAKARQAEQARRNQPQNSKGGNLPPLEKGKTRDKLGAAVGMSGYLRRACLDGALRGLRLRTEMAVSS
jgi:hypothetical protein